ncbi:MAG: hypothetical protein WCT05_12970, partial [Lentisphaeria bacterium]
TPKKFRVQFLVMQKSSKSLKIRIMKSIFSNFHPQIMVKKRTFFIKSSGIFLFFSNKESDIVRTKIQVEP